MKRASIFLLLLFVTTLVLFLPASIAQSGNAPTTIDKNVVLNVVVHHQDGQENINIDKERLLLFDASIQQQIDYLRADRTGSYVVILVDNSQTLRSEVEVLQKIVKAIVGELYEGDSV
ncbi:MAG: hypothetical protein JNN15_21165, partial [Blastocatellia bacterium]|nr:hypothetical protein [Blastocatellia bacterium]